MIKSLLKLLPICLFFSINLFFGQQKNKIDANTIFICIDSLSYQKIFSNSFVHDSLFICRENTTKTNDDNYTGKYAIGKSATIEFFQPSKENKIGNHLGDFGMEFKTRKLGALNKLIKVFKKPNSFKENVTRLFDKAFTHKEMQHRSTALKILYNNETNAQQLIALIY